MDFGVAVEQLPAVYARAVKMWSGGATEEDIATTLSVAPEAVPALVELGVAKLTAVLQGSPAFARADWDG